MKPRFLVRNMHLLQFEARLLENGLIKVSYLPEIGQITKVDSFQVPNAARKVLC